MEITCNWLTGNDLIASCGTTVHTRRVRNRTFRQQVGDRLLLEREQRKKWSRRRAAIAMHADAGTIQALEQGGNAGWDFFERYSTVLGLTFERVCREVLMVPTTANTLTPEEDVILTAYRRGTLGQRSLLLQAAQAFDQAPSAHEPQEQPKPDDLAAANDSHGRARKSQRR